MLNAGNDVLYVGKAKNVRKRLSSYARVNAPLPARILRMIAATVTVEIVSTTTETEALLLEANLIKQLRPRFNVQLRDDKSFPYILITGDHWAPQILKHRGAQSRPGRYFGPFASAGAVNRTITALQRAFLIRSCTDGFFESRTRPCLLYQIRRCSGPCTARDRFPRLYRAGARGERLPVRPQPCREEGTRRRDGEGVRANSNSRPRRSTATASPRCRRSSRSRASIRARWKRPTCSPSIRRAAIPASRCSSSAPARTGATAPISRARRNRSRRRKCWPRSSRNSTTTSRRRNSSCCRTRSRKARCWPTRSRSRPATRSKSPTPKRGEKKELIAHALTNAREALGRKLSRYRNPGPPAAGHGRPRSDCRMRRSASRSTTTATSRAPTRSAR